MEKNIYAEVGNKLNSFIDFDKSLPAPILNEITPVHIFKTLILFGVFLHELPINTYVL